MFDTVPPLVNAPAAAGKADELRHPANGLVLDLGRGGRPHGQVRVEAGCEQVADARRSRARTRRRTRRIADGSGRSTRRAPRRASSSTSSTAGRRSRAAPAWSSALSRSSIGGSVGAGVIEAAPAGGDDLGRAVERLLARDVEAKAHAGRIGMSASMRSSAVTRGGWGRSGSDRSRDPRAETPSRSENSAPWQAQRIASPSIQPSPSGHSSCVHHVSKAT